MTVAFTYDEAFARNRGLLDATQQARLRGARVAIAGLGGVGGAHVQAMARLGVGALTLADLDVFEAANLNRQLGATVATLGAAKVDVLADAARAINPDLALRCFDRGIGAGNVGDFLAEVDVVIDGLDYFAIDVRRLLFDACRARGIPIVTAGPIGHGAAVLVFTPDGPSFDAHFGIRPCHTRAERLLAFSLGIAPGLGGGVDPAAVDIAAERGPALVSACLICAGAAATEVLKLLLGIGRPLAAPRGLYYDAWRGRTTRLARRPRLRGLRGKLVRWIAFGRFPALRSLHERELRERAGAGCA